MPKSCLLVDTCPESVFDYLHSTDRLSTEFIHSAIVVYRVARGFKSSLTIPFSYRRTIHYPDRRSQAAVAFCLPSPSRKRLSAPATVVAPLRRAKNNLHYA